VSGFLLKISARSAFGIVPISRSPEQSSSPGRERTAPVSYRYFMSHLNAKWWLGNNAHLAGTGVTLCAMARLFHSDDAAGLAQQLLDWILGPNPFDVCPVNGLGQKNPPEYVYTGFSPRTPKITGSVTCGITGDVQDRPDLQAGSITPPIFGHR
jgi:hypothetical protein